MHCSPLQRACSLLGPRFGGGFSHHRSSNRLLVRQPVSTGFECAASAFRHGSHDRVNRLNAQRLGSPLKQADTSSGLELLLRTPCTTHECVAYERGSPLKRAEDTVRIFGVEFPVHLSSARAVPNTSQRADSRTFAASNSRLAVSRIWTRTCASFSRGAHTRTAHCTLARPKSVIVTSDGGRLRPPALSIDS